MFITENMDKNTEKLLPRLDYDPFSPYASAGCTHTGVTWAVQAVDGEGHFRVGQPEFKTWF